MIHICIPAHNEERTVGVLLWKIRQVMAEFGRDYGILVLDDGSTDRTAEVLERYRTSLPLVVLSEERRVGYRAALERLLGEAVERAPYPRRDAVVTLQGDFTESPEQIVPLVKAIEGGADVVAGVVEDGAAPAPRAVRLIRRAAPLVVGPAYGRSPVSDPLSGFRAYRVVVLKKALREVNGGPLLRSEGWAANLELLDVVARHARRIEETPLSLRYDLRTRDSRLRPVRTLRDLFRLRGRGLWSGLTDTAA